MMWFLALPRQLKAAFLIAACAFLLFAGVGIYMRLHDRSVIKKHEAEVAAQVFETELNAERVADRNDEVRRVVRESQTEQLEAVREEAIHEHPETVMAGPAVAAVLAELRRQAGEDRNTAD